MIQLSKVASFSLSIYSRRGSILKLVSIPKPSNVTLTNIRDVRRLSTHLRFFDGHPRVLSVNNRKNKTKYDERNHTRSFSVDTLSWVTWMSESKPVLMCQSCLEFVHSTTNLPWWAVIVMTTIGLRMVVTFPVTVYQHVMIARLQNLQPEIKEIAKELKRETQIAAKMYEWPEKYSRYMYNRSLKKQVTNLIIRDNCHPFKSTVVILIQLPLWISVSFALRNMVYMMPINDLAAHMIFLELAVGGTLWFPNLTVPDHTFILPVSLGLLNWTITEVHALRKVKVTRFQQAVTNLLRLSSLFMILIASSVPSSVALYWTLSSLIGLIQNIILQIPRIRRICYIPQTQSESKQPIQDIIENLRKKLKI